MSFSRLVRSTALLVIMASPLAAQATAPSPLSAADSTRFMELGRTYIRWMLQGQADSLAAALTPEFLETSGGATGVSDRLASLPDRAGTELKLVAEKMTRRNGRPQFLHEAEVSVFVDEPLVFRIVFDDQGKVTGIGMGP